MAKSVLDVVIRASSMGVLTINEAREQLGFIDKTMGAQQERMKHACGFCHGHTFDDTRGNCGACGGPRDQLFYDALDPAWQSLSDLPDRKTVSVKFDGLDLYAGGEFCSHVGEATAAMYSVAKWIDGAGFVAVE